MIGNYIKIITLFLISYSIHGQTFFNAKNLIKDEFKFKNYGLKETKKAYKRLTIIVPDIEEDSIAIYIQDTLYRVLCLDIIDCQYYNFEGKSSLLKDLKKKKNVSVKIVQINRKRFISFKTTFYDGGYLRIEYVEDRWIVSKYSIRYIEWPLKL